jgi:hypothetical protein
MREGNEKSGWYHGHPARPSAADEQMKELRYLTIRPKMMAQPERCLREHKG